jgi:Sulfotransferase domain
MDRDIQTSSAALKPLADRIRTINLASEVDQRLMETDSWLERSVLRFRRMFLRYYFVRPPLKRVLLRAALSKDRMPPNFASLGAVRSGTSLLSDYLMQHPCVVLPLAKEIGVGQIPIKRLIVAQFPTRREQKKVEAQYGEGRAITGYCSPAVPFPLFSHLAVELAPDLRFILILRDPVDRTFAHWRWDQMFLGGVRRDPMWRSVPDFDGCVQLELESMRSYGAGMRTVSGVGTGGYIQHSIYLPFIKNIFRFFGPDRTLFVNSQDFFTDPVSVAKTAYRFLGLPEYEPVPMPVKNAGPPGTMLDSTRETLREFFRPLNQELYQFLGRDFGWQ